MGTISLSYLKKDKGELKLYNGGIEMIGKTMITVIEHDIDEMGHVNNKVYLDYLEKGRENWFEEVSGMNFLTMKERNLGTVVIRIEIDFKKEALLGDRLKVETIPAQLGNKSFKFKQVIYNQHNELLTEALVTCVMFDPTARKSIPVIEEIKEGFKNCESVYN
jgi:YbgC/YbaW family acyl-CoA thioester hydrolase